MFAIVSNDVWNWRLTEIFLSKLALLEDQNIDSPIL